MYETLNQLNQNNDSVLLEKEHRAFYPLNLIQFIVIGFDSIQKIGLVLKQIVEYNIYKK